MSNLAFRAMQFAREAHKDHVRKYSGNPYFDHLAEVAGIVATADIHPSALPLVLAVAWLHDYVEDINPNGGQYVLTNEFESYLVVEGVMWLSDLEQGNRAERKAASRERLARAPGWVQTIKCADLISNTSSIVMHDPKFAVTYLEEKRQLLAVLTKADRRLHAMALQQASIV